MGGYFVSFWYIHISFVVDVFLVVVGDKCYFFLSLCVFTIFGFDFVFFFSILLSVDGFVFL